MTPEANRRATKAVVRVEPLEGRQLLSHARPSPANESVQVETAVVPPSTPTGHATNHRPGFYSLYQGPRRAELLAISTTGDVVGTDLILTGTVGGPIVTKPANPGQEATYSFGINRGGAATTGTLPTSANQKVSFDSVVVVAITQKGGITGVVKRRDSINPLLTIITSLKSSAIVIHGNTLKVTVSTNDLPSSGKAINQWRGAFFTRVPRPRGPRGVASLVPMFDDYPIGYRPK
ncbi:MAG: hypothetical protein JWN86_911 [Planctomycetota bacterium]|nr:hypothetical protein [Planctomycetota bacterium]